jgi:hypothetical protein
MSAFKYFLPALVWVLITFVITHAPELILRTTLHPGLAQIVHAGMFFVLCWLVKRAFDHQEWVPQLRRGALPGSFIFCCIYGVLDEFHQDFLPGHSSSLLNLIAAIGGALLFAAIVIASGMNWKRS